MIVVLSHNKRLPTIVESLLLLLLHFGSLVFWILLLFLLSLHEQHQGCGLEKEVYDVSDAEEGEE